MIATIDKFKLKSLAKKAGYTSYKQLAVAMDYNVSYFSRMLNTKSESNELFIRTVCEFLGADPSEVIINASEIGVGGNDYSNRMSIKFQAIEKLKKLYEDDYITMESLKEQISRILAAH